MRRSGILLPITSLPSKYGIGCFSKEAYQFVDFLKDSGQTYWQILPLGPTSFGDSPYQSFSTFAGNPYFIDLEMLIQNGLLTKDECDMVSFGDDIEAVDYGKIYENRFQLLKKAYKKADIEHNEKYLLFCEENIYWLDDYALYMSIKKLYNDKSWEFWGDDIRLRSESGLMHYRSLLKDEIEFYRFLQFMFFEQWNALKKYANNAGISIIGDIPIYVAFDSADAWAHPELFEFDHNHMPIAVAGCPPDGFYEDGQLWGNPIYDWEYHKKTDYAWWIQRFQACYQLYDVIRIDHFRGFDEYYSIEYGEETARNGKWVKGPGIALFESLKAKLGNMHIIAEDLGFITDSVKALVAQSGFPNMKVLEFAFDSREIGNYLPFFYDKKCVVYTGTHDNDTVLGWYTSLNPADKQMAIDFLSLTNYAEDEIAWQFIRLAMLSVADTCIIPLQDYLGLGSKARMNTPSTLGNNWKWRMTPNSIDKQLAKRIYKLTYLSARLQEEE